MSIWSDIKQRVNSRIKVRRAEGPPVSRNRRNRRILFLAGAGALVVAGFWIAVNRYVAPRAPDGADLVQEGSGRKAAVVEVEVVGTRLTPSERETIARGGESLEVVPAPPVEASSSTEATRRLSEVSGVALGPSPPAAVAAAAGASLSPDEVPSIRRVGESGLTPPIGTEVTGPVEGETDQDAGREPVAYQSGGHRDPFRSLLGHQADDSPLLDLTGARLVGIARSDLDVLALLEDRQGRSFALRPGDRIRSGRLARVDERQAAFSVWLYGRTESRVLELTREEGDHR